MILSSVFTDRKRFIDVGLIPAQVQRADRRENHKCQTLLHMAHCFCYNTGINNLINEGRRSMMKPEGKISSWFLSFSCRFLRFFPHLSALTPAHSRLLPHTPAHADAQISTGEWQKPSIFAGMKAYYTAICHKHHWLLFVILWGWELS